LTLRDDCHRTPRSAGSKSNLFNVRSSGLDHSQRKPTRQSLCRTLLTLDPRGDEAAGLPDGPPALPGSRDRPSRQAWLDPSGGQCGMATPRSRRLVVGWGAPDAGQDPPPRRVASAVSRGEAASQVPGSVPRPGPPGVLPDRGHDPTRPYPHGRGGGTGRSLFGRSPRGTGRRGDPGKRVGLPDLRHTRPVSFRWPVVRLARCRHGRGQGRGRLSRASPARSAPESVQGVDRGPNRCANLAWWWHDILSGNERPRCPRGTIFRGGGGDPQSATRPRGVDYPDAAP
jgi:hypothetical protein